MLTGVDSISFLKKRHELGIKAGLVKLGQLVVAEYLVAILAKPFALADMEESGATTEGEIMNNTIIAKTVRYDIRPFLIFAQ